MIASKVLSIGLIAMVAHFTLTGTTVALDVLPDVRCGVKWPCTLLSSVPAPPLDIQLVLEASQ